MEKRNDISDAIVSYGAVYDQAEAIILDWFTGAMETDSGFKTLGALREFISPKGNKALSAIRHGKPLTTDDLFGLFVMLGVERIGALWTNRIKDEMERDSDVKTNG